MIVDIWSDVACPWCYIGKRRLEAALARTALADGITRRWRAFELDPAAPRHSAESVLHHLQQKYRMGPSQVAAMVERVRGIGAEVGISFQIEQTHVENTVDAHRLIALAGTQGKGSAMKERLMSAYFCEGRRLGDRATLLELAGAVGVTGASELLDNSAALLDRVRADEAEAKRLGVTGVPFFVFDGKLAVSGGQPESVFVQALQRAWGDRPAPGEACGPEGCEV